MASRRSEWSRPLKPILDGGLSDGGNLGGACDIPDKGRAGARDGRLRGNRRGGPRDRFGARSGRRKRRPTNQARTRPGPPYITAGLAPRSSIKADRGRAEGGGSSARSRERRMQLPGPAPGIDTRTPGTAGGHSGTIGRDEARRMPGRTETIDHPGVCVGRRMRGSLPYAIIIESGRRTTMEGMSWCVNTKAT